VVEQASVQRIFSEPQHPYSVGLLGSLPRLDEPQLRLAAIEGQLPDPLHPPQGCRFAARCPFVQTACLEQPPALRNVGGGHLAACRRAPLDPAQLCSGLTAQPERVS